MSKTGPGAFAAVVAATMLLLPGSADAWRQYKTSKGAAMHWPTALAGQFTYTIVCRQQRQVAIRLADGGPGTVDGAARQRGEDAGCGAGTRSLGSADSIAVILALLALVVRRRVDGNAQK